MFKSETGIVILILFAVLVIAAGVVVLSTRHVQGIKGDLVKIGGSELNPAGQYVEAVNYEDLTQWFVIHKSDRKVVAVTGVGQGIYGADASFIIVSEPVKNPIKEKPSE